jgi:hypothetical protein
VTAQSATPKYNPELVERAVVEIAIEAHPASLTIADLLSKVASDFRDRREVDTITCAVRSLKGWGLLQEGRGEKVEPTPAALRFNFLLLAGPSRGRS